LVSAKVSSRVCQACKQYFPSKKALLDHRKAKFCLNYTVQDVPSDEDEISDEEMEQAPSMNDDIHDRWPVINEFNDEFAAVFEDIMNI
jgi:hypothetical protein